MGKYDFSRIGIPHRCGCQVCDFLHTQLIIKIFYNLFNFSSRGLSVEKAKELLKRETKGNKNKGRERK